jgi:TldD protein
MTKTLTVVDDPTMTNFNGTPIVGGYKFDDDGVPAQKVTLVDNGTLKAFCQSRIPTRQSAKSNGHSMGGHGVDSVIVLTSSKLASPDDMKRQITELAKDAGLDYILVVKRISDEIHFNEYPAARTGEIDRTYATPSYSRQPSDPLEVYRMYLSDGHMELIRGIEFTYVSLRAFRDIQAVGDDAAAYMLEPQDGKTRQLITPSYLVGELELIPVKPEHASPPILPSPLALEDETKKH